MNFFSRGSRLLEALCPSQNISSSHLAQHVAHAFPVVSITDEHDLTFHFLHLHPKVGDHVLGFRIGGSVSRVSGSTVWGSGSGVGFVEVGLPTFFTVKSRFGSSDSDEKRMRSEGQEQRRARESPLITDGPELQKKRAQRQTGNT